MYRAWNPDFYGSIQRKYPKEYGDMQYRTAFNRWRNSFVTEWPNLLKEPDSELVKVDEVRLRAVMAMVQILEPMIKGTDNAENRTMLIKWAIDNFNGMKLLFGDPLILDYERIESEFATEEPEAPAGTAEGESGAATHAPKPFAAIDELKASVNRLVDSRKQKDQRLRLIKDAR
jgi:hypothetical protein